MKKHLTKALFFGLAIAAFPIACTPDRESGDGNGLTPKSTDASFTVSKTSENHFTLTSSNNNYIFSKWDLDDEGGFNKGPNIYNIFLPDAGTYNVKHQIIGAGGAIAGVANQTITVPTSDPVSGNLVKGGAFANAADWSNWTVNITNTTNVSFNLIPAATGEKSGKALLIAKENAGRGIYQAIQVVAGRKYNIDMIAGSTSGCENTWFEVYVGYDAPVPGQDYSGDGTKYREINTWAGTGTAPFNGKISVVGSGPGVFTATKTGTVYLGIRGGGGNMKDGIYIKNVEFRGMP